MDTKGENIARPELRPQAETHALVVPVSGKRANGHYVKLKFFGDSNTNSLAEWFCSAKDVTSG
jgi:hypothetical protein